MIAWRLLSIILAFTAFTDAAISISEFQHMGDLHIGWTNNSIIAGGFWTWQAFRAYQ